MEARTVYGYQSPEVALCELKRDSKINRDPLHRTFILIRLV